MPQSVVWRDQVTRTGDESATGMVRPPLSYHPLIEFLSIEPLTYDDDEGTPIFTAAPIRFGEDTLRFREFMSECWRCDNGVLKFETDQEAVDHIGLCVPCRRYLTS
jgi:hypothetical protein